MTKLRLKNLIIGVLILIGALSAKATTPPKIQIDTATFAIKINNKPVDHTKFNDLLTIMDREYRKVDKSDKTLYIFDEFGFIIIKEKKGITYSFLFSKGTTIDEPKSAFNVILNINQLLINSNTPTSDLKNQLPTAEKSILLESMFIYVNKKFITMSESKDGKFTRLDLGYKAK